MRRDVDGDVDTSPDVRIQGAADECAVHTDVDEAACSTTGSDRVRHSDGQINCNPIAPPVFHPSSSQRIRAWSYGGLTLDQWAPSYFGLQLNHRPCISSR